MSEAEWGYYDPSNPDGTPDVCINHMRFLPCRHGNPWAGDNCVYSNLPRHVTKVRRYQNPPKYKIRKLPHGRWQVAQRGHPSWPPGTYDTLAISMTWQQAIDWLDRYIYLRAKQHRIAQRQLTQASRFQND